MSSRPEPPSAPAATTATTTGPRWLHGTRGPLLCLALILLFCAPSLSSGWLGDDLIHHEMLVGGEASAARTADLAYCFSGGPKRLPPLAANPWWTNPSLRLCYFRPLSSLTLALDHHLFWRHPALAHVHSWLWFLLACGGVYSLARILLDARAATLAALIYGTSSFAFTARVWIAARHACVSAALTAIALALYVRGRERHSPRLALCGLVLLAAGLLGGEGALGGFGFVLAYELVRARDAVYPRLAYGAAATAIALGYVVWYARSGFGAVGCGAYLDPMRQPSDFLLGLPGRLLTLLAQAVLGIPSGPWMLPPLHPLFPLCGVVALLLLLAAFRFRAQPLTSTEKPTLHFLAVGSLLGAFPATTALFGGRVLMIPGIGLSLLLALAITPGIAAACTASSSLRLRSRIVVLLLLAGVCLAHPIVGIGQIYVLHRTQQAEQRVAHSPIGVCATARHVYVLGTNEITIGWYAPYLLQHSPRQRSWDQLSLATGDLQITRHSERALCLRAQNGRALAGMLYKEFGPPYTSAAQRAEVTLSGATVRLGEVDAQGVRSLCVELNGAEAASADDPRYCWLRYDGTQLVSIALPAVGSSLVLPYVRGLLTD